MNRRTIATLAVSLFALSACGFRVPLNPTLSQEQIAQIVAAPDR